MVDTRQARWRYCFAYARLDRPLGVGDILVIVLLVFGPKRLPEAGRSLGKGMREFKNSITGNDADRSDELAVGTDPSPRTPEGHSPLRRHAWSVENV